MDKDIDYDYDVSSISEMVSKPERVEKAKLVSSSDQHKVVPLRIGLKSKPPAIVLLYDKFQGELRKRRKRYMPLRNFSNSSDVQKETFTLRHRHAEFLDEVPTLIIEKFMRIIQEVCKGIPVDAAVQRIDVEYGIDPDEDLNKVSPAELARKKEIMQESFLKNLCCPGDPGFVYDNKKDFSGTEKVSSEWDEDERADNAKEPEIPQPEPQLCGPERAKLEESTAFSLNTKEDFNSATYILKKWDNKFGPPNCLDVSPRKPEFGRDSVSASEVNDAEELLPMPKQEESKQGKVKVAVPGESPMLLLTESAKSIKEIKSECSDEDDEDSLSGLPDLPLGKVPKETLISYTTIESDEPSSGNSKSANTNMNLQPSDTHPRPPGSLSRPKPEPEVIGDVDHDKLKTFVTGKPQLSDKVHEDFEPVFNTDYDEASGTAQSDIPLGKFPKETLNNKIESDGDEPSRKSAKLSINTKTVDGEPPGTFQNPAETEVNEDIDRSPNETPPLSGNVSQELEPLSDTDYEEDSASYQSDQPLGKVHKETFSKGPSGKSAKLNVNSPTVAPPASLASELPKPGTEVISDSYHDKLKSFLREKLPLSGKFNEELEPVSDLEYDKHSAEAHSDFPRGLFAKETLEPDTSAKLNVVCKTADKSLSLDFEKPEPETQVISDSDQAKLKGFLREQLPRSGYVDVVWGPGSDAAYDGNSVPAPSDSSLSKFPEETLSNSRSKTDEPKGKAGAELNENSKTTDPPITLVYKIPESRTKVIGDSNPDKMKGFLRQQLSLSDGVDEKSEPVSEAEYDENSAAAPSKVSLSKFPKETLISSSRSQVDQPRVMAGAELHEKPETVDTPKHTALETPEPWTEALDSYHAKLKSVHHEKLPLSEKVYEKLDPVSDAENDEDSVAAPFDLSCGKFLQQTPSSSRSKIYEPNGKAGAKLNEITKTEYPPVSPTFETPEPGTEVLDSYNDKLKSFQQETLPLSGKVYEEVEPVSDAEYDELAATTLSDFPFGKIKGGPPRIITVESDEPRAIAKLDVNTKTQDPPLSLAFEKRKPEPRTEVIGESLISDHYEKLPSFLDEKTQLSPKLNEKSEPVSDLEYDKHSAHSDLTRGKFQKETVSKIRIDSDEGGDNSAKLNVTTPTVDPAASLDFEFPKPSTEVGGDLSFLHKELPLSEKVNEDLEPVCDAQYGEGSTALLTDIALGKFPKEPYCNTSIQSDTDSAKSSKLIVNTRNVDLPVSLAFEMPEPGTDVIGDRLQEKLESFQREKPQLSEKVNEDEVVSHSEYDADSATAPSDISLGKFRTETLSNTIIESEELSGIIAKLNVNTKTVDPPGNPTFQTIVPVTEVIGDSFHDKLDSSGKDNQKLELVFDADYVEDSAAAQSDFSLGKYHKATLQHTTTESDAPGTGTSAKLNVNTKTVDPPGSPGPVFQKLEPGNEVIEESYRDKLKSLLREVNEISEPASDAEYDEDSAAAQSESSLGKFPKEPPRITNNKKDKESETALIPKPGSFDKINSGFPAEGSLEKLYSRCGSGIMEKSSVELELSASDRNLGDTYESDFESMIEDESELEGEKQEHSEHYSSESRVKQEAHNESASDHQDQAEPISKPIEQPLDKNKISDQLFGFDDSEPEMDEDFSEESVPELSEMDIPEKKKPVELVASQSAKIETKPPTSKPYHADDEQDESDSKNPKSPQLRELSKEYDFKLKESDNEDDDAFW